jgi:hypothetical protein
VRAQSLGDLLEPTASVQPSGSPAVLGATQETKPATVSPKNLVSISPAFQELVLSGDHSASTEVEVTSTNTQPLQLFAQIIDLQHSDPSGLTTYVDRPLTPDQSPAKFVEVTPTSFELQPGTTQKILLKARNAPSLEPGGHYGSLVLTTQPLATTQNESPIAYGLSSGLLIRKEGGERFSLTMQPLAELSHIVRFANPSTVAVTFENLGNTHVRPHGKLEVRDIFGNLVSQGMMNEGSLFVLPQTRRQMTLRMQRLLPEWPIMLYRGVVAGASDVGEQTFQQRYHWITISPLSSLVVMLGLGCLLLMLRFAFAQWRRRRKLLAAQRSQHLSLRGFIFLAVWLTTWRPLSTFALETAPQPPIAASLEPTQHTKYSNTKLLRINDDGSRTFTYSASLAPQNFKYDEGDPNEPWKPIRTTIERAPDDRTYAFQATKNAFQSYFRAYSTDPDTVKYQRGASSIAYTLHDNELGALQHVKGVAHTNTMVYPQAFTNIDVRFSVQAERLLEEFILERYQPVERISQRLVVEHAKPQAMGRTFVFVDPLTQRQLWTIAEPILYERDNPDISNLGVSYELQCEEPFATSLLPCHTYRLTKVLTEEGRRWLADPARQYPVVIDAAVDLQVSTGNDDGDTDQASDAQNSITRITIPVGSFSGNPHMGAARFNNVTIDQGTTIDSATFNGTSHDDYNCACTISARVYLEDADTSAALTTTNINDKVLTTANSTWDIHDLDPDTEYSVSITSAVQEVLDRAGWASGNSMSVLLRDNSSTANEYQIFWSYNGNTSFAPELHITYTVSGEMPSSTAYQMRDFTFSGGGLAFGESTSYGLNATAGEVSAGNLTGSTYDLGPGLFFTQQANVPAAPTLTNVSNNYNKLRIILDTGSNPSDTLFAVAISSDNFVTTSYVQSDFTVGTTLGIEDYMSYATWGSGTGQYITGLNANTTYKVKVKALHGKYTETQYSTTASAATSNPSLAYDIDVSSSDTETASPYQVAIGSLTPATVVTATDKIWIDLDTNAEGGAQVYMYASTGGLLSSSVSSTITSASVDLAGASSGVGARSNSVAQTSGGPLAAQSPYNGASDNVGLFSTSTQTVFTTTSAPIVGGRGSLLIKAKAAAMTPAAGDYATTLTMIASATF